MRGDSTSSYAVESSSAVSGNPSAAGSLTGRGKSSITVTYPGRRHPHGHSGSYPAADYPLLKVHAAAAVVGGLRLGLAFRATLEFVGEGRVRVRLAAVRVFDRTPSGRVRRNNR